MYQRPSAPGKVTVVYRRIARASGAPAAIGATRNTRKASSRLQRLHGAACSTLSNKRHTSGHLWACTRAVFPLVIQAASSGPGILCEGGAKLQRGSRDLDGLLFFEGSRLPSGAARGAHDRGSRSRVEGPRVETAGDSARTPFGGRGDGICARRWGRQCSAEAVRASHPRGTEVAPVWWTVNC